MTYVSVSCQLYTLALLSRLDFHSLLLFVIVQDENVRMPEERDLQRWLHRSECYT